MTNEKIIYKITKESGENMKKISKKNKIIILTAIASIIVIIGILIGTNAIKVNILTGKFNSANNDSSNGNLLPEYIKAGITLGGVTGTLQDLDTSDATATPEDIALGKTAYVNGKKITGTRSEPISDLNPDEVYYADLTGDGTVDGVIYADLAVGGSGVWNNDPWSYYSYEAETGLKEYCIINEEYTDEHFGTGKVIAPKKGTSGKDRFYVMALDDINPGTRYCWYDAASGKLDKTVASYYNDFGEGRTNTEYVMNKWKNSLWGKQNDNGTYLDMWGVIEEQFNDGWFVPSKSEWSAFGDKFKITSSNYVNQFGLSDWYWFSSEFNTNSAYYARLGSGSIGNSFVYNGSYVRLSTTF